MRTLLVYYGGEWDPLSLYNLFPSCSVQLATSIAVRGNKTTFRQWRRENLRIKCYEIIFLREGM